MEILLSLSIGYLLGSLSPSALISKVKRKDLRELGTKNLGATNTMLAFGKWYGLLVMFFDMLKAIFAVKLAKWLFPVASLAGLLAGSASVVGHVFPFYLKFKGGKGLAPFGGLVLAVDPLLFIILLVFCSVLMVIVNYSVAMPMSAAILFPILHGLHMQSVTVFLIAAVVSLLIAVKHYSNIHKARIGEDVKIREYIKTHLFH